MAKFEVSWSAFGTAEVEADNEAEAVRVAYENIADELFGVRYDGLDVGDYVDEV